MKEVKPATLRDGVVVLPAVVMDSAGTEPDQEMLVRVPQEGVIVLESLYAVKERMRTAPSVGALTKICDELSYVVAVVYISVGAKQEENK